MNRQKACKIIMSNPIVKIHECNKLNEKPNDENSICYMTDDELTMILNDYYGINETVKTEKPIIEEEINLSYTKGKYSFFTKSVAKLFVKAFAILKTITEKTKITIAKATNLVLCLWIVNHLANKLEGISSISSSVHDNCFCKARQAIKDCICKFCYAYNQQSYQTGLKEHNILNGIILRNVLIPIKAFKALTIVFPYLRIESFGDVSNVIQARNYIRIIKAFPEKRCAIWTKNILIWKQAIDIEGKPKNTTFVYSSSFLNKPIPKAETDKYDFIDHVFTVYTKEYAKKNNITINCGGRKCIECIMKKNQLLLP